MRVRTFDMMTGEAIECELKALTMGGLMTLMMDDGKAIVRHMVRCQYDPKELRDWEKAR